MRFAVVSAYLLGVALPVLETVRRGIPRLDGSETIAFLVDDWIVGALLLWAAISATRGVASAPVRLVMAWGVLVGGAYGSFFGQLESGAATDVSGASNVLVAGVKGALFLVSILALIASMRAVGLQDAVSRQA